MVIKVKVGEVYYCLDRCDSHFIAKDIITITEIDTHVHYRYASDGWETKKEWRFFTTEWLKTPTKLELYLLGATNVEVD